MAPEMIQQIPDIPDQIVDAINWKTLAVFIGAGVSRTLGCVGWNDLSESLMKRCTRTKKGDGSPCLDEQDADLLRCYDNKKKITICKQILYENGCEAAFFDEIERTLTADPDKLKTRNIYDELWGFRALYITTNVDEYFDVKFTSPRIAYLTEDFIKDPDRNKLYHIHGKLSDRGSIVLTTSQYITRYNAREFQDFLTSIFAKYTVLFVGYGLEEFELLDFLMNKYNPGDRIELKHYILKPFRDGEEGMLRFEEYYYNSMGINVIPYVISDETHRELFDVIHAWNQEINQTTQYLHGSFGDLEMAVENPTAEKIEDALQFIQNDTPQRRHLFRLLESAANPQPWLKALYDSGYLDPDRNPRPQKAEGKTGYYRVPYWEVLGFLENVAARNLKVPSDAITQLILKILEDIISYRTEKGERIDNHYTDASMVTVIFSLPLDRITNTHYEFIRAALKTSWDTIHIATAIEEVGLPRFIEQKEKKHLLKLIEIIFEYTHQREGIIFEEYTSLIDPYTISEILKGKTKEIAEICGHEAAEVALRNIHEITKQDSSQFDHIWIPAIEKEDYFDRFDVQIIGFIKTIFEDTDPASLQESIDGLLREEHPIFKRIAIHTINHHYDTLQEIFWGLDYNPITEYQLEHEVRKLLCDRCVSFSQEKISQVIHWICDIPAVHSSRDPAQRDLYSACVRKWWLSTIEGTGDPEVRKLYNRYNAICPMDVHPLESGPETVSFIGDQSPIAKEDLLRMPVSGIVQYLCSYTGEPGFTGLSSIGLARVFENCVATDPDRFYSILEERPDLPSMYLSHLLRGFANAGADGSILDWSLILDYILYLVDSEEFWNEETGDAKYGFDPGAVIAIGDLICESINHDEYISRPELRSKTERIFTILADRTKTQLKIVNGLEVSWAVVPQTSVFRAMISYSVHVAPISERESGSRWVSSSTMSLYPDITLYLPIAITESIGESHVLFD